MENRIKVTVTEIVVKRSLKGMTGGWSKWGGSQGNVVKEKLEDKWFCQNCGEEQPISLSPYLQELVPGEYFRICAKCLNKRTPMLDLQTSKLSY